MEKARGIMRFRSVGKRAPRARNCRRTVGTARFSASVFSPRGQRESRPRPSDLEGRDTHGEDTRAAIMRFRSQRVNQRPPVFLRTRSVALRRFLSTDVSQISALFVSYVSVDGSWLIDLSEIPECRMILTRSTSLNGFNECNEIRIVLLSFNEDFYNWIGHDRQIYKRLCVFYESAMQKHVWQWYNTRKQLVTIELQFYITLYVLLLR